MTSHFDVTMFPGISVYGPQKSGKTVLVRGFLRAIGQNQDEILTYSGMQFCVTINGLAININGPGYATPSKSTKDMVLDFIEFGRLKTNKDYDQEVSEYIHRTDLIDTAGGHFNLLAHPSVIDPSSLDNIKTPPPVNELIGLKAKNDWVHLGDSKGIVVILDPTMVKPTLADLPEDHQKLRGGPAHLLAAETQLTYDEYARIVEKLTDPRWIDPRMPETNQLRWIALCITKIDQLRGGLKDRGAYRLVYQYKVFGEQMIKVVEQLKRVYPDQCELFSVSAFGYDTDGLPNYDPKTGWLKNTDDPVYWVPVRAHEPFIWIYEGIEKSVIVGNARPRAAQSRLEKYIHYRKPKQGQSLLT